MSGPVVPAQAGRHPDRPVPPVLLARRAGRAASEGGVCGAANWSEVAQKVRVHSREWVLSRSLLLSYGLVIEPVTVDDAERAARSWHSGQGLSLADRLCLAPGDRLDVPVPTADREWGVAGRVRQIR